MNQPLKPLTISLPRKVLSIIPAVGWKAVYAVAGKKPRTFRKHLACFALVETSDGRVVEGYTASDFICPVEKALNFLGYEAPDESGDFTELWQEWQTDENERVTGRKTPPEPLLSPFTFSDN